MFRIGEKFDKHKKYFASVAMATLLCGAGILALGIVELGFNLFADSGFSAPMSKVIGGFIVLSLGYIHLELEMIRTK